MKRKLLTLGALVLLCVAMIGTGFAGWVISSTGEKSTNGNITTETVSDARYTITEPSVEGVLHLGKTSDDDCLNESPWLTNSPGEATVTSVSVTATVTSGELYLAETSTGFSAGSLTVTGNNSTTASGKVSAKVEINDGAWKSTYDNLVSKNIITGVEVTNITVGAAGKVTVTISLNWDTSADSAFGTTYKGPYGYYNDEYSSAGDEVTPGEYLYASSGTAGDDAKALLKAVESISAAKYKVTITVSAS